MLPDGSLGAQDLEEASPDLHQWGEDRLEPGASDALGAALPDAMAYEVHPLRVLADAGAERSAVLAPVAQEPVEPLPWEPHSEQRVPLAAAAEPYIRAAVPSAEQSFAALVAPVQTASWRQEERLVSAPSPGREELMPRSALAEPRLAEPVVPDVPE